MRHQKKSDLIGYNNEVEVQLFESLLGKNKDGIEKKIRMKKDEINFHKQTINYLELDIEKLQDKLKKLERESR